MKRTAYFMAENEFAADAGANVTQKIRDSFGDDSDKILQVSHDIVYDPNTKTFCATAIVLYKES